MDDSAKNRQTDEMGIETHDINNSKIAEVVSETTVVNNIEVGLGLIRELMLRVLIRL